MIERHALLGAGLLALAAAAGLALAVEARPDPGRERRAAEFQRLVGGLGPGPADPDPVLFDDGPPPGRAGGPTADVLPR